VIANKDREEETKWHTNYEERGADLVMVMREETKEG
jgi:hypothetical protein